jgi:hypothetical protein
MIDLTLNIGTVLQLAAVIVGMVVLYVRVTGKMKEMDSGVIELRAFREAMTAKIDSLRASLADNLVHISNNVASLSRQLEEVDKKYVRRDVHDAHLAIINEKLRGIERIEKDLPNLVTRRVRK